MSKISVDQKTIKDLFQAKGTDFLIPDYQRPYDWGVDECTTLWDDIFAFAFPDGNPDNFDGTDEYFLGPIVVFKNEQGKLEVIDGQQRLTSLMLLLRAYYARLGGITDEKNEATCKDIEQCIWKTDEFGKPHKGSLKIDSLVATDDHKDEFLQILKTGTAPKEYTSNYARTYRLFEKKVNEFVNDSPIAVPYLPTRTMKNCVLLPIEADSRDTALRIFSTLNDRGKPLSDADIFKAQMYQYFVKQGKKAEFVSRWKKLEATAQAAFEASDGNPLDELFVRYMHYQRSVQNIKNTTTEAIRKFYERDNYRLLKSEQTFAELESLALFWKAVMEEDTTALSTDVLRRMYVLNAAPNKMWTQAVSVYFLAKKNSKDELDEQEFLSFLNTLTGFLWAQELTHPGVSALRTPLYPQMRNVAQNSPVAFQPFKEEDVRAAFGSTTFSNSRTLTRSMITWWAFENPDQELLELHEPFQLEHIYPKARFERQKSLPDKSYLEKLGNKALLERSINIAASDYRFEDRAGIYNGKARRRKKATKNAELLKMAAERRDFNTQDIDERTAQIVDAFIEYMRGNNLLA